MDFVTRGQEYHAHYALKLQVVMEKSLPVESGFQERYRLYFLLEGSGTLTLAGRRRIITAPVVLCLNEVDECTFEPDHANRVWHCIFFHPDVVNKEFTLSNIRVNPESLYHKGFDDIYWLRPFTLRDTADAGILEIGPSSCVRVQALLGQMDRELETQRDGDWPCRSRSFLFELLFLLQHLDSFREDGAVGEMAPSDAEKPDIREILLCLHANMAERHSLESLTKQYGTNRTTLGKRFQNTVGMPVMAYLLRIRTDMAKHLLQETLLPVSEIHERVGFPERTHFARTFKQQTGYAPVEYRKQFNWMLKR